MARDPVVSPRAKFTGKCRYCGCSSSEDETRACNRVDGKCHWFDFERTVCSSEACIRAWSQDRAKFKALRKAQGPKKTPAENHAGIWRQRKPKGMAT